MKIAIESSFSLPVAPSSTGAVPSLIYNLAEKLSLKNHSVDVYGTGDSLKPTHFNLIPVIKRSLWLDENIKRDIALIEERRIKASLDAIKMIGRIDYDIIHIHRWYFMQFIKLLPPPLQNKIVITHHSSFEDEKLRNLLSEYPEIYNIFISKYQKDHAPKVNRSSVIYNGIDLQIFPFKDMSSLEETPLFFIGRITPEKGAMQTLDIKQRTGKNLLIAGIYDPNFPDYFNKFQTQANKSHTVFFGEIDGAKRLQHLQHSRALLMPIMGEEAFGLMFIEAMACGTPVLAFAKGSVPEVIKDGETGFIVNPSPDDVRGNWIIKKTGIEGLCEAVERIYSLPDDQYRQMRLNCRKHVEENFTVECMVDEYEKVYRQIIG